MGNLSKICLQILQSIFVNIFFKYHRIILTFCTEHGSDTAMLCAKYQNDWTAETDIMTIQVFLNFSIMMGFSYDGLRMVLFIGPNPGDSHGNNAYISQA